METRARYVLIGSVTLLSLLGLLAFLLWLAKVQIDRTFTQYDILFDTVAGLNEASAVRYAGIDVGKVLTIALDRTDPGLVRVRIEVYASTPVRVDTVATLSSQGVTGVSFVSLEGGDAGAPRLERIPPATVAVIPSQPSVVQGLIDNVPDLLAEAQILIERVSRFATPENQEQIAAILVNINAATARFDTLVARAERVLATTEATLDQAKTTLAQAESALASADRVMTSDVPGFLDGLGAAAAATLAQADTVLADAQTALASADRVMTTDVPEFIDGLGTATAATLSQADTALIEAQSVFANANSVIVNDVPAILDQLGAAADGFAGAAAGLQGFSETGLLEYTTLASDARALVASLGAVTDQIAADPGRFLLGDQTPTYRRD